MLITLVSSSNSPQTEITNYFKDGLLIPKHAKIGVVSASYNIQTGYTIDSSNDVFYITLGSMYVEEDIALTNGVYATLDLLAAAIQTSLRSWMATTVYTLMYPASSVTCTATNDLIEIDMLYDRDWNTDEAVLDTSNTSYTQPEYDGSGGCFYMTSTDNSTGLITSNKSATERNYLFASKMISGTRYSMAEISVPDTKKKRSLILTKALSPLNDDTMISKIEFYADGLFDILEDSSGFESSILSGSLPYVANTSYRVLIKAINTGTTNCVYQQKLSGGDWTDIAADPGKTRFNINFDDKLFAGCILTEASTSTGGGGTVGQIGLVGNNTVTTAGTNYLVGERFTTSGGGGSGCIGLVLSVDGSGGIATYSLINKGSAYGATDVLTVTGKVSLQADARITLTSVNTESITLSNPGTGGYFDANDVETSGGSGFGLTVDITVSAGLVLTVIVNKQGSGYSVSDSLTIQSGSFDATITLNYLYDSYTDVYGLKATLTPVDSTTDSNSNILKPLTYSDSIIYESDTLGQYLNFPISTTGPTITSESVIDTRIKNKFHVQLDHYGVESRDGEIQGKTIAVMPLGSTDLASGGFYYEPNNILYHSLKNTTEDNHNQMRVRFTNSDNTPFDGLLHPIEITLDMRA